MSLVTVVRSLVHRRRPGARSHIGRHLADVGSEPRVDERRHANDGRLRHAIPNSTSWWVTVRYGKRGRRLAVPLQHDALDALAAWLKAGPICAHEQLLVSLPRTGRDPQPLTVGDVSRIVTRYAKLAVLPEDRRSPHMLRHTFCTHLAESGEPIEVIRELAGHADIRTTTIYTDVSPDRLQNAIDAAALRPATRGCSQTVAGYSRRSTSC